MTLNKIYKIVANRVNPTVPGEIVLSLSKEIEKTLPDFQDEVEQELWNIREEQFSFSDSEKEMVDGYDENYEEGLRQDPSFTGLLGEWQ